jgi:protein TonB
MRSQRRARRIERHAAERDRFEPRRIVAAVATLLVHSLLLALLLEEPDVASQRTPASMPLLVRIIVDPRGQAAGPRTEALHARAPSAAPARIDVPAARRVAAAPKALAKVAKVLVPAPLPLPAIDPIRADGGVVAGAPATRALADSGSPGAAGSGRNGSDEAGSFKRIAFVYAVKPGGPALRDPKRVRDAYVIVAVHVDEHGSPHEVRMVHSSGMIAIDDAVRRAARQSRYAPHLREGKAIEFWGLVPYVFGNAHPDIERALAEAGIDHT